MSKIKNLLVKLTPKKRQLLFIFGNFVLVITLCAVGGVVLTNILTKNSSGYVDTSTLSPYTIERKDILGEITQSGSISSASSIGQSFKTDGTVSKVYFKNGDLVKTGDLLAELTESEAQKDYDTAVKKLTELYADLSELQAKHKIDPDQLKSLENSVFIAETNYNNALAQRNLLSSKSEIAGKVYKINILVGNSVDSQNNNTQIDPEQYNTAHMVIVDSASYDELQIDPLFTPVSQLNIYAQINGKVNGIPVVVGSEVNTGTLLFTLDTTSVEIEIKESENGLISAKKALAEYKSNQSYNDAASSIYEQIKLAQTSIAEAEVNLKNNTLTATADGILKDLNIKEGQKISANPSTPHMTISDPSKFTVQISISSAQAINVAEAMPAIVTINDLITREYAATVKTVKQQEISQDFGYGGGSTMYDVELEITNADEFLSQGMSATVYIETFKLENVVAVPIAAIKYDNINKKLTVQKEVDGEAQVVNVKVGKIGTYFVEIVEGVSEGEVILQRTSAPEVFYDPNLTTVSF